MYVICIRGLIYKIAAGIRSKIYHSLEKWFLGKMYRKIQETVSDARNKKICVNIISI